MKRIHGILAMVLAVMIAASLAGFTNAETPAEDTWQADILKLMDSGKVPASTHIHYDLSLPEGEETETKVFSQELVSSNGDVLNVEFRFLLRGPAMGEGQWTTVTDWLKQLIMASVQRVQADPESLANVIAEAYAAQRANAQPGETGMPAWASENLLLQDLTATVPYYPELSNGVNGGATQRLQDRLITLGYLDDAADGFYGGNTQAAVEQLERYVRQLEQDVIDRRPEPTATPEPTPTPTPEPNSIPMVVDVPLVTPEPSFEPAPTPITPVDGVADPLLQAYLFSDDFKVTRGDLRAGDQGEAVSRIQVRLARLGYSAEIPDGVYGGGTARSVRIFQYYNGLDQTGIADTATQSLLFSKSARKPDNAMLTLGSSGDAVSKLQKRLRVLGFAAISVDGGYGESTKRGVETLQQYMRELEGDSIAASADVAGGSAQLTVEVNGIADPMILDDFYSDSFPAIPAAMSTGSSGRDVVRLQRRLAMLEYYYSSLDGDYGSGTAEAVASFQKRNGLSQTGQADRTTLETLFNENAKKALKPYLLKVSVSDQRVYAYAPDADGEYTNLVRTMKCSTGRKGTPTPTGTFQEGTGPGARWHYFKKFDCWAQYAYYIQGDIMFHSVLYNQKEGRVTRSSVNHLGSRASHGCVRLSVEDAKWIWSNCPQNTKVIIK